MNLEKIAQDLACKTVAAKHADTKIQPGQYAEWALEFKKLAHDHYAEIGLTKEAEEPSSLASTLNPYSAYDKMVDPSGLMANPMLRNALVTGGLGAGVGALGSLASNLFSRKKKKRYLSDALSSGLVGGLAGGLGGAGYTALKDPESINNLVSGITGQSLEGNRPPQMGEQQQASYSDIMDKGKQITDHNRNLALSGLALGTNTIRKGYGNLASGEFTTRGNIPQIIENTRNQLESIRKGLSPAQRPTFDAFLQRQGLLAGQTATNPGTIAINNYGQVQNALRGLDSMRQNTVPYRTNPSPGVVQLTPGETPDIPAIARRLAGLEASSPGVLQGFTGEGKVIADRIQNPTGATAAAPSLQARLANELQAGAPQHSLATRALNTARNTVRNLRGQAPVPLPPPPPEISTRRFFDPKGFAGKSYKAPGKLSAFAAAAPHVWSLAARDNPEARAQGLTKYLKDLADTAQHSSIGGPEGGFASEEEKKKITATLADMVSRYSRPTATEEDVNRAFNELNRTVFKTKD